MTAAEDRWAKPTLVGDLVTLRPYSADDAEAVWEMVNDPEGRELTGTTAVFTRDQIRDWVATRPTAPERLDLVIVERASGEFAGQVVLCEFEPDRRRANLRIALRSPEWYGQGLGTEALRMLLNHAFSALPIDTVDLAVLVVNARARHVYDGIGFAVTKMSSHEGQESVDMEMTRAHWENAQ